MRISFISFSFSVSLLICYILKWSKRNEVTITRASQFPPIEEKLRFFDKYYCTLFNTFVLTTLYKCSYYIQKWLIQFHKQLLFTTVHHKTSSISISPDEKVGNALRLTKSFFEHLWKKQLFSDSEQQVL